MVAVVPIQEQHYQDQEQWQVALYPILRQQRQQRQHHCFEPIRALGELMQPLSRMRT